MAETFLVRVSVPREHAEVFEGLLASLPEAVVGRQAPLIGGEGLGHSVGAGDAEGARGVSSPPCLNFPATLSPKSPPSG